MEKNYTSTEGNDISLEECNSTWSCPVLLGELAFGDFSEYFITRHHIKTGKYLYILYYYKLCSSLNHFFHCENYYMMDDMYNCLADLKACMESTITRKNQSGGEIRNSGKSPLSLGAYKNVSGFDFISQTRAYICKILKLWSGILWLGLITVFIHM